MTIKIKETNEVKELVYNNADTDIVSDLLGNMGILQDCKRDAEGVVIMPDETFEFCEEYIAIYNEGDDFYLSLKETLEDEDLEKLEEIVCQCFDAGDDLDAVVCYRNKMQELADLGFHYLESTNDVKCQCCGELFSRELDACKEGGEYICPSCWEEN